MNFENGTISGSAASSWIRLKRRRENLSPDNVRLLSASGRMLRYVQPDLKDIADRYTVVSNGASKYAFVVSRNANIDVRLFFAAVSRKSKIFHNVRAQAL